MAVSYKKLFHLLIEKDMTNAQLQQESWLFRKYHHTIET